MPPPPPALPDELIEEILLRLPPEDPGCLFRASLVSKPWRSRLTGSAFARLYREFHGTPPLLGFFENDETVFCWFAPLSPTSPFAPVHPDHRNLFALDSRHGLVLLNTVGPDGEPLDLVVWDPVGRRKWELPYPEFADWGTVPDSAAVLCAVDGCDHLHCHGDPFLVAYVGTDEDGAAHACLYSSEARAWSPVTSYEHPDSFLEVITSWPVALVGNALHFPCSSSPRIILRYDLFNQELSVITWPDMYKWEYNYILMRTEDGVLGCASLQESMLELWSMESGADGAVKWVLSRVVELENWIPSCTSFVTSFADGVGVFFVRTNLAVFTVELKSGRVKKVSSCEDRVIPYMSFYTPDQSGCLAPPSTMTSSSEKNVETAREEHDDRLLLHSSGEVADEKEKWVEKAEEDCKWDEGGWHEEGSVEDWEWKREKALEQFQEGSKAFKERRFGHARNCFHYVLTEEVFYCGRLSPICIMTYYKYGHALLYEAKAKIAQYQDLVEGSASRDDIGSSKASCSNVREDDTEKDLDLAWKMLHIARAIHEKCPFIPMEGVKIFRALAEVSLEREDIDYALRCWFKALANLEHLVEPDHCQIILLNLHIFLTFKSASKIDDAVARAAKVFSLYKSRMQKHINANKTLLAVKGDSASAAEVGSEISSLDNEIELLSSIFTVLVEKFEELTKEMLTTTSKPSGARNAVYAAPRASSLTSEIAGPSNSLSTTATIETPGSTGTDLETAGQANVKQIAAESSLKKLAEDSSSLVNGDSSNKSDVHPAARDGTF